MTYSVIHEDLSEQLLLDYYRNPTPQRKEQVIKSYLPLVKYIVGRIPLQQGSSLELSDLYQFGVVGLLDALDRYNPTKGVKFKTYAYMRIKGEIYDALRREYIESKDRYHREKKLNAAKETLRQQLGRDPSPEELQDHLNMTPLELDNLTNRAPVVLESLDQPVDDQEVRSLQELIADPEALSPEEIFQQESLKNRIKEAIKRLPERQRLILALYYYEELTLADISKILEVTESRVSQILKETLKTIRKMVL